MNANGQSHLLSRRLLVALCAALMGGCGTVSLRAATINWDGGASTGDWGTATNWSNNTAWNSANTANFDTDLANSQYSITLGADRTVRNITFSSGTAAQGFTFNAGNILTVNNAAGIVNNDGDTQTFATAITLGANQTWNAASGAMNFSGNINNGTRILTLTGTGTSNTISGIIGNGSGGITKTGTSTWTLSGTNTYTGVTTINAGTLSVGIIGNGGVAGNLGAATNAANRIVLGGGTLQYTGATASTNRNFTLTAGTNSTIDVSAGAANLTISGASTSTTGGLTKTGAGTLTLSGTNLYTGTTTVTAGTLAYGVTNALSSGAVNVNGGTLDIGTFSDTVGAVTLTSGNLNGSSGVLTGTSYAMQSGNVGAILGGSGGLTKTTAGTVTLSGVNSYTGATTINAGTLSIGTLGNGGVAGNMGAATNAANRLVLGGGTLQYTGTTSSTNRNFTLTAGTTSTINVSTGATNLTVSGASTSTTGALTKTGAGTLTLTGASLYSGLTTVSQGVLNIRNATATGTTAGGISVTNGAALELQGGIAVGAEALTLNGTGLSSGGALRSISGANSYAGAITLGSTGVRINSDTAATALTLTGGITGTGNALTIGGAGDTVLNTNGLNTSTGGSLTKDGTGTLTINASGNYTGSTTINAGVLKVGNATALGSASTANVAFGASVAAGTKLQLNNTSITLVGLNSNATPGSPVVENGTAGTATLTVNNAGANTFAGTLANGAAGTLALTKGGAGTLTLSGTNTYTGTTTVNAGTLFANGSASLGATTGNVTVSAGTLALAGGADITSGSPTNAQTITKSGTLSLSGSGASASTGALHAAGTTGQTSQWLGNITLAGNATISAADNLLIIGDGSLYTNTINLGGNTLTLNATSATGVVPEFLNFPSFILDSSNILINSAISGTGGLVKDGAGTVTMLAYPNNSYTGTTVINDGKLIIGGDPYTSIISSASVTVGNNSGAANSAVLQMGFLASPPANNDLIGTSDAGSGVASTSMTVNADGFFDLNGGSNALVNLTLAGGHVGDSYLPTDQFSLLNITGGITTSSSTQTALINNWTLAMENSDFTVNVADGAASTDFQVDAILVNGGSFTNSSTTNSLVKTNTGTLLLTGANTHQGITSIQGGVLSIQHSAALGQVGSSGGDTTNGTVVQTGAQLKLDGNGGNLAIGNETLTLNGSGVATTGALLNAQGDNTYNGRIKLETSSRVNAATGTSLTIGSTPGSGANFITGITAGQTLTVGGAGNTTVNGVIASSIGTVIKDGTGTLTLSGQYSANSTTTVQDGTLALNLTNGLTGVGATVTIGDSVGAASSATLLLSQNNQIVDTASVSLGSDGLFNVNGKSDTIGSIAGSGMIMLGTGQLIAGGNDASTAFSGTLTGDASSILSKAGSGTLTINSNVNAVAGDFAGTLNLTGGGLTFNVSNAFTGTVNISAGTTLKLSDTTLNIANLNFTGTGAITLDFSGAAILSATNLVIGSGVTINIINWSLATDFFFATNWTGATFDLANNGNTAPMNQAVFTGFTASQTGWDSYDNQIRPNVPEPSTYGALLLASLGALFGWRRFRQARAAANSA